MYSIVYFSYINQRLTLYMYIVIIKLVDGPDHKFIPLAIESKMAV